ncbi:MAG: two-component regulator propeller domain-containing protein [Bacteroidota bacterium]
MGWAQLPSISFENITTKEGLPSNTVLCATKDHQGFMWFGTRRCPTRYDGATFRNFLQIETNFVTGLAADSNHHVWASTDRSSVCTIDVNTLEMLSVKELLPEDDNQTGFFFIDSRQQGWYSDRSGVNRVDLKTRKKKHYPFRQTTYVWVKASFLEDKQHNIWVVGSDNGLFQYNRVKDTLVCVLGVDSPDPSRREPIVFNTGCVDQQGLLWMGSQNRGLIQYNPTTHAYKMLALTDTDNFVNAVEEGWDENGQRILWIGDKKGLSIFRPEQQKLYRFPALFSGAYEVYDIFRDPQEGIVWICTSEGVLKYHPRSNFIQTIQIPPGLVDFPVTVNTFLQDKTDTTGKTWWLGLSHTGMLRWNRQTNQFTLVAFSPAGSAPETRWMVQRDDGTLWIGVNRWGYTGDGLVVFDPRRNQFLQTPLSKLANRYYSVPFFMYGLFDQHQRLWIGNSDEGIHVLDEKLLKDVSPWDSLTQANLIKNNNLINDMRLDRQGRVWLATLNGVYYVDAHKRGFVKADSLAPGVQLHDLAAISIFADHRNNLWAARWGSVTKRENGSIKTVLTTENGLYDRENQGLAEDWWGNIWIGNYEGLHSYNPHTQRLIRFTESDGLLSNNTLQRLYAGGGKELLIGQKNAINLLKIEKLLEQKQAPQVAVSAFKIHEQERHLDLSKPIRLKRSENAFSVDFIALNYTKLQNNQYAYYLEGFEKKWNYIGSNHLAYYTNLDPGRYTLHLKAGDAFGNWNKNEIRLQLVILPAFYETWWFQLLVLAAIVAFLYGFYRFRINQLLRLQQMRNRISADLHDEIGASLSGIGIMGMMAQKTIKEPNPAAHFLERMVEEAHQISTSLDDIVWSINPKNDGLANLIARMARYASELFEAKGIDYQLEIPEHVEQMKLTMEQRRDFYLIFKEAINNLVKYARCDQAQVEISFSRHQLRLIVRDNGIGFDPDAHSDRNGIRNLKKRSENLKGTLRIQSALGRGTEIQLEFPVSV